MKIKIFFVLVCGLLVFFANTVKGQSYLEVENCKSIVAYYDDNLSQGEASQELSYILEKELIQGVWEKVIVENSFENIKTFADLPIGIYRVSIIPLNVKRKNSTKVYKRKMELQKAVDGKYDVFISNSVEVTGAENCDKQMVDLQNGSIRSHLIKVFPNPVKRTLNIYGIYIVCIYSNGEVIHSEKVSYLGR